MTLARTSGPMPGLAMSPIDILLQPTPVGPVPMPFPAQTPAMLHVMPSAKHIVMGGPMHNLTSTAPVSGCMPMPGTINGGMAMGPASCLNGSTVLSVLGAPATTTTNMVGQNQKNCVGPPMPSQMKFFVMR